MHLPAPLRSGDVVVVVGVGASGMAAIRVLERLGMSIAVIEADPEHAALDEVRARGHRVVTEAGLTDTVPPEHPARAESSRRPPAADAIDQLLEELLDTAALVVPSPGVSEHARVLVAALDNAIPVWSEPQLGLRAVPHQTIGVTGTNGKTSTTELITAMLTASGLPALACGNIGRPVADTVLEATADVTLVAELSSFQLRFTERLGLVAGVLLNLAEDHLDWHESMQAYGAAKAQIWHGQGEHDWSIANADDAQTLELQRRYATSQHAQFSSSRAVDLGVGRVEDTSEGDLLAWCDGTTITPLVAVSDLWSSADHHVANVAAAATAAMLVGATRDGVKQAAQAFRPGNHRGIVVAKTAEITWVNDSKATNPHAAAAALTMAPHIVWIAGGVSKGVDFVSLRGRLSNVDHAVVIGEAAAAIASVCRQEGVPVTTATSIEDAVARAEHVATAGATVVLAPACASFDQFANYQERGQRFVQAVDALLGRVAS
ncbi:MAG: UDP-N-acetylmuramoyl-L-alanine--D-glutamate ligase [Nitriliruptoraceae bacterium]